MTDDDWTPQNNTRFMHLWNTGVMVKEIQREFGMSRIAVWKKRKAMGLPDRKRPGSRQDYACTLRIRMTKDQVRELRAIAQKQGIPMTELMRRQLAAMAARSSGTGSLG